MLRITVEAKPRVLMFRLEGRLEGPWVAELEKSWRERSANARGSQLHIDLTDVTFVDAAGKALLTAMGQRGARFIADDCLNTAIVDEIGGEPLAAASISEQLVELDRLRAELLEISLGLARAAKPLERLPELTWQQRAQVGEEMRAGLTRWTTLTRQISRVLSNRDANGTHS